MPCSFGPRKPDLSRSRGKYGTAENNNSHLPSPDMHQALSGTRQVLSPLILTMEQVHGHPYCTDEKVEAEAVT